MFCSSSAAVPHCTDWQWHLMLSPNDHSHQVSDSTTIHLSDCIKEYAVFNNYDQDKQGHKTYDIASKIEVTLTKDIYIYYRYHDAMICHDVTAFCFANIFNFDHFCKGGRTKRQHEMIWHCVSLVHLLSFLGRLLRHVGARTRGWCRDRRRWKDSSIPTDNHILYPGLFLRSKLKLPRGGYFARVCWKVKRDVVRSWILSVSWFEGHVTRGVWKMSLD